MEKAKIPEVYKMSKMTDQSQPIRHAHPCGLIYSQASDRDI